MNKISLLLLAIMVIGCERKKEQEIDLVKLKTELDSIQKSDQRYRRLIGDSMQKYDWNSPQIQGIWQKQAKLDSVNLNRVLEIIEEIGGYPGDSLVGYPTRKTAFFVLQHAPDSIQAQYLDMILNAAKEGQLDKNLAAMYHDRYLMHRGLPQIYGSQLRVRTVTDSVTGEQREIHELYKLADTSKVDSLRMANQMIPLEEYLNINGIEIDVGCP